MNHVLRKIFLVTYFHPREFIKLVVYYFYYSYFGVGMFSYCWRLPFTGFNF